MGAAGHGRHGMSDEGMAGPEVARFLLLTSAARLSRLSLKTTEVTEGPNAGVD